MFTTWPGAARLHLQWWTGRAGLLVVIVGAGYWLSLASLWRGLGGQTPLAFVGLAPLLALGLLVAGLGRRQPLPLPGRVDLLIGLALLGCAGAVIFVGPFLASVYFWAARLDIVSLPLFVGGALVLLYGWRVLFASRGALMLLLMTWPLPYMALIESTAQALTQVTSGALSLVTSVVPIATQTSAHDATFTVAYAPGPFAVQVATACAGLNSTVAFLLVGSAFMMLLTGRLIAKLAWLAVGLALVFLLNVVRVVLLVAVGAVFGESAAMNFFHPVAGMLALLVGLLLMLALVSRFGLRVPALRPASPQASPVLNRPAPAPPGRRELASRTALLIAIAVPFAIANGTFATYDSPDGVSIAAKPLHPQISAAPVSPNGPPSFAPATSMIADRVVVSQKEVTVGKPYYGADSKWVRYVLARGAGAPAADRYRLWLDDIRVTDRQTLVDFGVEKCYAFHGQSIDASQSVALGKGVVGRIVVTNFGTSPTRWVVLWWEWPISVGSQVENERIVLLATEASKPTAQPAVIAGQPLVMLDFGTTVPDEFRPLANDLASLASHIVTAQSGTTGVTQ